MKTMNHSKISKGHYSKLGIMFVLHFIAMYMLMYAMVNNLGSNVYNSMNQVYMAALMTSSMVSIELALMKSMYPDAKKNAVILLASILLLVGSWLFIRKQVAIGDEQFVRSMIPHHSGAILMCKEASINDPELKSLCQEIKSSQQREIDQMKAILGRLNK